MVKGVVDRVLVHYHEIALKGRNRPLFVQKLARNIERALEGLGGARVRILPGRLLVDLASPGAWPEARDRLKELPGIANFSPAARVELDVAKLSARAADALAGETFASFRVTARRVNKQFPLNSMDVEREVGRVVKERTGARVDLTSPTLTLYVDVLPKECYFYFEKHEGTRGMPVGSSGRVLSLLSGGIDSPVAAFRMMKRGCRVSFVHFHSVPFLSRASQEKVKEIVELLTRHQSHTRLFLVAFGEVQRRIRLEAPAPLRVVLYRRGMMRIATALARRTGCRALVTGESLGQVASQTLDNLAVIEKAAGLLLLRPLVGMDKDEITAQARRLGTYEISIQPDQDCCQLFIPPHPATRANLEVVEEAERQAATAELEAAAAAEAEEVRFGVRGRATTDA